MNKDVLQKALKKLATCDICKSRFHPDLSPDRNHCSVECALAGAKAKIERLQSMIGLLPIGSKKFLGNTISWKGDEEIHTLRFFSPRPGSQERSEPKR